MVRYYTLSCAYPSSLSTSFCFRFPLLFFFSLSIFLLLLYPSSFLLVFHFPPLSFFFYLCFFHFVLVLFLRFGVGRKRDLHSPFACTSSPSLCCRRRFRPSIFIVVASVAVAIHRLGVFHLCVGHHHLPFSSSLGLSGKSPVGYLFWPRFVA